MVELIMAMRRWRHARQSLADRSGVHCAVEYTVGKVVPLSMAPVANRLGAAVDAVCTVWTSRSWMRPTMRPASSPGMTWTFHRSKGSSSCSVALDGARMLSLE